MYLKTIKKISFNLAVICLLWLPLYGCQAPVASPQDFSLREKIGQMIMIGFQGTELHDNSYLMRDITVNQVGGVVFFNQLREDRLLADVPAGFREKLRTRITALKDAAKTSLFVAIDQEGGTVSRLKEEYGFPPTISAQALGLKNNPDLTYSYAKSSAVMLRQLGINLNLAPVVDLNRNPDNPVIGQMERSYSADPEIVVRHALRFIEAHREQGILCVLKHFPGHGSSTDDSHHDAVDVSSTWSPQELLPFQRLINAGHADAIMTAHIYNSRIDEKKPATLSAKFIDGLLRGDLNFSGLVITDDLLMNGLKKTHSFDSTIIDAVNAGADILLFVDSRQNVVPDVIRVIEQGVRTNKIDIKRIEKAFSRIIKTKSQYL
jgi:beta-N-acetylhexosaminidase